jgi:transposase-like protein
MKCPRCNCINVIKDGFSHNNTQHYKCKDCNHHFEEAIISSAKTLIFDIENAPTEVYAWNLRLWQTNISQDQMIKDWYMLTWCAKWLNDSKVFKESVTPKEARKRDDKRIVKNLWKLFNEADVIVAHNAFKFDIPMTNTRFITLGMKPPSPYRVVDTLKVAKKIGLFTYNHLDYLGKVLGVGRKKDTDFQLWIDCVAGDQKALDTMLAYNAQDVLLLEEVYLKFRGWTTSHPNMNMYQSEQGCSHCGSMRIKLNGYYTTQTRKYKSFRCEDCGGFSRETKKTLVSTAR